MLDSSAALLAGITHTNVIGFATQGAGLAVYVHQGKTCGRLFPTASFRETLLQHSLRPVGKSFKRFAEGVYVRAEFVESEDPHGRWIRLCNNVVVSLEEAVRASIQPER